MGDAERIDATGHRQREDETGALQPSTRIVAIYVTINTPRGIDHAGTDANVFFVISGQSYLLDMPEHNDFERGTTDTYQINLETTLGELRKETLEIGHDNSGRNPGWYCGVVQILIEPPKPSGRRLYGRWSDIGWLAADENQGQTYATLQHGELLGRAEQIPTGEVPAAPAH